MLIVALSSCGGGDGKGDLQDTRFDFQDAGANLEEVEVLEEISGDSLEDFLEEETANPEKLVQYIDPFIATGGIGFGIGSSFPGASAPFGMVKPSPDTTDEFGAPDFYHCAGYYYNDPYIEGFSQTHMQGTGVPDYGNLLVMPVIGMDSSKTTEKGYRSKFSHAKEYASPGYYSVMLEKHGITAEITATERAAHYIFTFPANIEGEPVILVDLAHTLGGGQVSDSAIRIDQAEGAFEGFLRNYGGMSGYGFNLYFYGRIDKPFESYGTWSEFELFPSKNEMSGNDIGGYFVFDLKEEAKVEVKIAISYIDEKNAKLNLDTEMPGWNFEKTRKETEDKWEKLLSKVVVKGGSVRQKRIFYTALYHALLMPAIAMDVDGRYRGFDRKAHEADGFTYYIDMSLWDTFRTAHPLYTVLFREEQRDMVISLIKMYEQSGVLPRWPTAQGDSGSMIGSSADIVIADTYLKGIKDFDLEKAYEGIMHGAMEARPDIKECLKYEYCPADTVGGSVSVTLEYAYNDFAAMQVAEALGMTTDREMFAKRYKYYTNLFDKELKFFRGKNSDGSWAAGFNEFEWETFYVEGNAWHLLWYVPYETEGLIELFGGTDEFVKKLEFFFEEAKKEKEAEAVKNMLPGNYYWHGNEPDIQAVYQFAEAGRTDLTQKWSRWIMETLYDDTPDGLAGNDDGGTLSAWYIFSALGFYPVPAKDIYILGSPLFDEAEIALGEKKMKIIALNNSPENIFVKSVTLNGKKLDRYFIYHKELLEGGELVFEMRP